MRLLKLILILVVPLFFFSIISPIAQMSLAQTPDKEKEEEFRTLFQEGIELFQKGELEKSYETLEKALRIKPPDDMAIFYRDMVANEIIRQMLNTPELRETARKIMELGHQAMMRWKRTPEQIKAIVQDLYSEDFDTKWTAIQKLVSVGQRACPFLIELLGNKKDETARNNAIHCLGKMKSEAVLPVIEALNSSNKLLRQNAAMVLSIIKDERTIAELKRVYENSDESPEVKVEAAAALKKITGLEVEDLKPAVEYYYLLAEKYYYSHPSVMYSLYDDFIVWRWDKTNDKVTAREVPNFTFNEELAEEACYDAIALDETYEPIWPLLICVYLAEYNESEITLESAREKLRFGTIEESEMEKLQADLAGLSHGVLFSLAGSRKYLYQALERSLEDNNVEVAVSAIRTLEGCAEAEDLPLPPLEMPPPEELKKMPMAERDQWTLKKAQWEQESARRIGQPLATALSHADKRIRYAAAQTLLKINPHKYFPGEDKVIPIIIEALGESGVRIVLIVEENEYIRNQLKAELHKLNCYTIETSSGTEGIRRAKRFPSEDLIILNSKIANQVVFNVTIRGEERSETVFDSFKEDMRTRGIPIFLLCEAEGTYDVKTQKNIYQENVQAYLVKPVDKVILKEEIEKVFASEEAQKDSKARAEQVAQEAAQALAQFDLTDCIYPYQETVEALIRCLENRPDKIRLPASKALGRFGYFKTVPALAKVFNNKENSKELRLGVCVAMAQIFRVTHQPIPEDIYNILKSGLTEEDFDIKKVVNRVLGNAALTPVQRKEVFELQRIHK